MQFCLQGSFLKINKVCMSKKNLCEAIFW